MKKQFSDRLPRLATVTVNAIEYGGRLYLIDRRGRRVGASRERADLIGKPGPAVLERWKWQVACKRAAVRFLSRETFRARGGWLAKADSLAASLRIRSRRPQAEATGKLRLQPYSTATWGEAKVRLWHQIHNRYRKHARSPWKRWAETAANNHNKKPGCRYGKARSDHGLADHGARREAGLQVCFDWSRTDAGNRLDRPHHPDGPGRDARP